MKGPANSVPEPYVDTAYEWRAVLLLFLGFGLVGLDRWIIAPLFPTMMRDLKLSYRDLGNAVGSLSLAWGTFSALMGNILGRIVAGYLSPR